MAQFLFPKPRDWEAFEDIVCDVFSREYQSTNFQRYARRGQRQHGVDVVGRTSEGVIGIQCKHHATNTISSTEIDNEINKAASFNPPLSKLIISTSAATDGEIQSHVLETTENRLARGMFPVEIVFWDKLVDMLTAYPDLLYKHFTKHFPPEDFESIHLVSSGTATTETIEWPVNGQALRTHIDHILGGIVKVEPFSLSVGISNFPHTSFQGQADVQVSLDQIMDDEEDSPEKFKSAYQALIALSAEIQPPYFSKDLTIYLQTRLSFAFLTGWVFRKVTGFKLRIISGNGIWATEGLPARATGVLDDPPYLLDGASAEVAIVLNLSQRDISASVEAFVSSWQTPPRAVLTFSLPEGRVTNAAHALSIAKETALKIKNLNDRWGATHIHIFGVLPAALACLIGYHLNATCPISFYYMDESRTEYKLAGTLTGTM